MKTKKKYNHKTSQQELESKGPYSEFMKNLSDIADEVLSSDDVETLFEELEYELNNTFSGNESFYRELEDSIEEAYSFAVFGDIDTSHLTLLDAYYILERSLEGGKLSKTKKNSNKKLSQVDSYAEFGIGESSKLPITQKRDKSDYEKEAMFMAVNNVIYDRIFGGLNIEEVLDPSDVSNLEVLIEQWENEIVDNVYEEKSTGQFNELWGSKVKSTIELYLEGFDLSDSSYNSDGMYTDEEFNELVEDEGWASIFLDDLELKAIYAAQQAYPEKTGRKKSNKKLSHHLWNSTATDSGDIMINRTKAEREDLDEFEFAQVKSAAILGLWGASMTDSPLFTRVPSRSAKVFEKTAQDMQKEGEVPPKVMSWEKLAKAFGADKVNECRESIQFGMKARLASKELNIPFVMAADLVEDWEKVGGKVLAEVVEFVKKEGQMENGQYSDDEWDKGLHLVYSLTSYSDWPEQVRSIASYYGEDSNGRTLDVFRSEVREYPEDFSEEAIASPADAFFSSFSADDLFSIPGFFVAAQEAAVAEMKEQGIDLEQYVENSIPKESDFDNPQAQDDNYENFDSELGYSKTIARTSSKFPEALVEKVREVLASTVPKIAIDQAAEEYYKAYWGPYGDSLVKEIKKRVKADLAKIWLKKQGVDEAAAEYWSSYYTDQNYGELMTATPKDRKRPKN